MADKGKPRRPKTEGFKFEKKQAFKTFESDKAEKNFKADQSSLRPGRLELEPAEATPTKGSGARTSKATKATKAKKSKKR